MKTLTTIKRAALGLGITAVISAGLATWGARCGACKPNYNSAPLTPQEVKDYSLTGIQTASGLSTVALGQPAYFDALINAAVTKR
jgi:hypothetical protein